MWIHDGVQLGMLESVLLSMVEKKLAIHEKYYLLQHDISSMNFDLILTDFSVDFASF